MSRKSNDWIDYEVGAEVDTDDYVLMKFMVRLKDGSEMIACYTLDRFLDLNKGKDINKRVVAYRKLRDEDYD